MAGPYGFPPGPKGFGKGKQFQAPQQEDWGIPGFEAALDEALIPVAALGHPVDEVKNKLGQKIVKAIGKFAKDERAGRRGTASQARGLIEDFVETVASSVSQGFYDKPWLAQVNLAAPLLAAALHTFHGAKIFNRTLAPMLEKYTEEGLFKHAEEERIQKAIWDAVVASGVKESHQKKANNHLQKAYDDAHIKAPYGTTVAESPELSMLQDFTKGWMSEFVARAWDILENGTVSSEAVATREEHILFLTVLFQNLTDSSNAALPHEITALIETPPPSPWAFCAETAEAVFQEMDEDNKQAEINKRLKKQQKGQGKGNWGAAGIPPWMQQMMMPGMF